MRENLQNNEVTRLILRFPCDDAQPILWRLISSENPRYGSLAAGETDSELASLLSIYPAWVLVSASEITFHHVTLPQRSRRQRLQVLPFILEDQLATEIEFLHFAILQQSGNDCDVAVVEKNVMKKWISRCEELGVRDQVFLPDVLMLPLAVEGWSAVCLNEQWLFRRGAYAGMVVESSWLLELLTISAPPVIECYSTPPTHIMDVEWQVKPERDLLQLAAEGEAYFGADLRQGEFTRPSLRQTKLRPWRPVLLALVIYVLLACIYMGVAHYRLWQQAEHWRQESVRFYQQLFPGEKKVVNPRAQMLAHLQKLKSDKQALFNDLIRQLQQLLLEAPMIHIQALIWDGGSQELKIDLQAASFQALEQFQQSAGKCFRIQPGEIRQNPHGVESRLTLGVLHE
ncbi:MAG: type II secretion system protein GspL [Hafnia sp.]